VPGPPITESSTTHIGSFCDSGYPGTTIEAIAAKAGVATQTVYYFFRTKALTQTSFPPATASV